MMGLAYSVASLSGITDDYDVATDLEALSGRIMTLQGADMRDIAEADQRDIRNLKGKAGVDAYLDIAAVPSVV